MKIFINDSYNQEYVESFISTHFPHHSLCTNLEDAEVALLSGYFLEQRLTTPPTHCRVIAITTLPSSRAKEIVGSDAYFDKYLMIRYSNDHFDLPEEVRNNFERILSPNA